MFAESKKRTIWLLALFAGILLFSGCMQKTFLQEDPLVEESDPTEIIWWTFPVMAQEREGDPPGAYEQKMIAAFEECNKDITVKLELLDYDTGSEKLQNAFAVGDVCDVLLDAPGRIIAYGNAGYLAPLDDLFTEDFRKDMDNSELLSACQAQDTPYMYPLSSAPFYMAFNRRMLKKAGVLHLVREEWTTKDFDQVLRALESSGYVPGSIFCDGTGGDQGTRGLVANLYDGSVTDPSVSKYTLGNAQGTQALSYIKSCVDEGMILNGTLLNGTEAIENFVYGRASFSILWGPSQQRNYKDQMNAFGVKTVEVPLPSADGKAQLEYLINGFCVMDNGNVQKIEAAKRFIQFACDDDVWGPKDVVQTGCIPVRTSFGELYEKENRMKIIEGWTKYYIPYYNTDSRFTEMRLYWCQTLQKVLGGYLKPEEAMDSFEKKANETRKP